MTAFPHAEAGPGPAPPVPGAFRHAYSHLRLWGIAGVGLALDLWSKDWAFSELVPGASRPVVPGLIEFHLSLNPGALFGLGANFAPLFVGASVLALMFVLYLFLNSKSHHRALHVGLALVLAGALGNLYDRVAEQAFVYHDPSTGYRHTGRLLKRDGLLVTVGDFQTGRNPQTYLVTSDVFAEHRPVVRDFIKIQARVLGLEVWPWVFNVADALLVIGVAILLLQFWFDHGDAPRPRESPSPP